MRSVKFKKIIMIAAAAAMLMTLLPMQVFADGDQKVTLTKEGATNMVQEQSIYIDIRAKGTTDDPYILKVVPADKDIVVKSGTSGIINTTDEVTVTYSLQALKGAATEEPHIVSVIAMDPEDETLVYGKKNFNIWIERSSASYSSMRDVSFDIDYDIYGKEAIVEGESNTLRLYLFNRGTAYINDASAEIQLPAGLSLKDGTTRTNIGYFNVGKTYTIEYNIDTAKKLTSGSLPIVVTLKGKNPNNGTGVQDVSESLTLYVPVIGTADEKEKEPEEEDEERVTPILMVSGYSYGGDAVLAGSEFNFVVTLQNTSEEELRNVKVTVDGGKTFIPVGTSSSYYIDSIAAKNTNSHAIKLSCARDADQAPISVSVSTTYEDKKGNKLSSSDVLSVPVVQEVRFSVDDIVDPGWLTADQNGYVQVTYYNLGRNTLSNMRISVEGDFTVDGNDSYYVGNMAPGKSDYYSINFWPNGEGLCNGKFIFSFEDAAGDKHEVEKEFTLNIQPAMVWDDPGWDEPMEPVKEGLPIWAWAAIGAGALVLAIVIIKLLKKRKAKKQEALELDA